MLDLALLPAKDQEEFPTVWSALSEKRQQDAALDVEKQFEAHMAKIGIAVDASDLNVLQADWANGYFLQILQAKEDTQDVMFDEFPFAVTLWPQKIIDVYKVFIR